MHQRNPIFALFVLTIACSEHEGRSVESDDASATTPDGAHSSSPRSTDFTSQGPAQSNVDAGDHCGASHTTSWSLSSNSRDADAGDFQPGVIDAAPNPDSVDASSSTVVDASSSMALDEVDGTSAEQALSDAGTPTGTSNSDESSTQTGLRLCSTDPMDTVAWECDEQGDDCATPVNKNKCPLPWACEAYSLAVESASDQCSLSIEQVTIKACDFRIIERRTTTSGPLRAFYASSGDLIGTWSATNAEDAERCSGTIPEACLDWDLANRIGSESLCDPVAK